MTRRPRRSMVIAGGLVLLAATASVSALAPLSSHPLRPMGSEALAAAPHSTTTTAATTTTTTTTTPAGRPALGVYVGPGGAAPAEAADQLLDGSVTQALDFLPRNSWATLTDPGWLAQAWQAGSFGMVLGVPMLPDAGASLAAGAAGDYDGEFTLLAQRLVADGLGSATLMIGWQPEEPGTPWQVTSAAGAARYVAFWDDIQASMAAVAGARFRYEWDAGEPSAGPAIATTYPGDAAVSIVATDAFDTGEDQQPPARQWSAILARPGGPAWAAAWARAHGKPLAVAMLGLVPVSAGGDGDNATFVPQALSWAATVGASFCMLWDQGSWGITQGSFPAAEARLVRFLSADPPASGPGHP